MRQLKQRIALRSQLEPLTLEETQGYIQRRLQLAAAEGYNTDLFPPETIASVYRHSRGIPRLINTVCENALITSFARQAHAITPDVIEEVAADFRLGVVHRVQIPIRCRAKMASYSQLANHHRTTAKFGKQ